MNFKDLSKMPKDEQDKKLHDLQTELMKLNAQVAVGTTPKNTKQIREIRRTIAKVETLRMQQFKKTVQEMTAGTTASKKAKSAGADKATSRKVAAISVKKGKYIHH